MDGDDVTPQATNDELAAWLISPAGPEPSPFDSTEGELLMDEIARRLRRLTVLESALEEHRHCNAYDCGACVDQILEAVVASPQPDMKKL